MTKNPTINSAIRIATIAGAAALVLSSAVALTKVKGVKAGIMPVVSILVGVAAFKYAYSSVTIVSEKKVL